MTVKPLHNQVTHRLISCLPRCDGLNAGSNNHITSKLSFSSPDLLGIRPAPNNGSHGSLNHLLRRPVHLPVHPAQLSHDSQCEANSSVPVPHPPCACSFQTQEMVRVDPNRRTFSQEQGGGLAGRLTGVISFQEAALNSRMQINDSRFLTLSLSAHFLLHQHSHLFHPGTKAKLRHLHQPFGTPRVLQAGVTFCLLHHVDYLNGYSHDRLMPLWVSYTIQPVVSSATRVSCGALV